MVPTSPTRELYVQGSQEHQRLGSNPRTGRLKTYALTTRPRESLTRLRGAVGYESSPEGGAVRCEACCACREAPVYVYGAGTGGEGAGWGAAPSGRRLTCTGVEADSSTAGSPTDVHGGRRRTEAPPDRRLTCRVEDEGPSHRRIAGRRALELGMSRRVADLPVGRENRGRQATTACACVCTPLPRGMPQG